MLRIQLYSWPVYFFHLSTCFPSRGTSLPNSMNPNASLFATLSDDELARVVRYVDSTTLIPLIACEPSEFAHVVHHLVSKLEFGFSPGITLRFKDDTLGVGFGSDYNRVKSVLENCGALKFKRVMLHNHEDVVDMQRFSELFGRFLCPEITLKFRMGTTSYRGYGRGYGCEFVKADSEDALNAIRSSPTRPVELLRVFAPSLKSFHYTGSYVRYFEDFWEVVGDSLEEVRIVDFPDCGFYAEWEQCIRKLKINCRKLTTICMSNGYGRPILEERERNFVDFICSYGPQLLQTNLHSWLGEESLVRIARECPNVRCNFVHERGGGHKFAVLSNRLHSLNCDYTHQALDDDYKWTVLSDAMKKCVSLVTLRVAVFGLTFTSECIKAFLPKHMHSLESLTLHARYDRGTHEDSFAHVATVTNNLRVLNIGVWAAVSPASVRAICVSNRYLHTIAIRNIRALNETPAFISPATLEEFIRAVLVCKDLRLLEIGFLGKWSLDSETELREIFWPLRSVSISIKFSNGHFHNWNGKMKFGTK